MTTLTEETAEALCNALHLNDFDFVDEAFKHPGLTTRWVYGESPRKLSVDVVRDLTLERVGVIVRWHNLSAPPRVVRTELRFGIDCTAAAGRQKAQDATGALMQRILEILLDVVRGVGYAGPEYLKKQAGG